MDRYPPAKKPERDELLRPKHLPLIGATRVEPPPNIPARMLNEVTYCERLMYLEWVQTEFADNYFTVDGRALHDRADSAGGKLPPTARIVGQADGEIEHDDSPYQARSVWLTSEMLGMTAKIAILFAASFLTKLAAVYLGALVAVHNASQNAPPGHG